MKNKNRQGEGKAFCVIAFILMFTTFFVITGCSQKNVSKAEITPDTPLTAKGQEFEVQKNIYNKLSIRLQPEIKSKKVEVGQFDNMVRITIPTDILFSGGGWTIDRRGSEILDKIVMVLKDLRNQAIEVNGYTDNSSVAPSLRTKFSTNRELSLARAVEIVNYFQKKGINRDMISATGYGAEHSVATNDTIQGRTRNRRMEVIVVAQGN